MYEFNINDYIWYIVGGVALFFVLVGFIADKSGLAKKTFSKDSVNKKKVISEPKSDVAVAEQNVSESFVSPINSENSVVDIENNEQNNFSIESTLVQDADESDETIVDQKENLSEETSSDSIDSFATEEPIYLNDDEEVSEDSSLVNLENSYSQNEDSILQNDEDSVWDLDSNDVVLNDSDSSVAVENAEDDWGIEPSNGSDTAISLEDVDFPSLDDINSDTEEDVWKF